MNLRLTSWFVAALAVALLFFSATIQPNVSAAPGHQDDDSMAEGQEYTIQTGDSLYKISEAFLGNGALWPEIQAATNAMAVEDDSFATIDQPRLIRTGQKIWIPAASADGMKDDDAGHEMSSDADMNADDADTEAAAQTLTDAFAQLTIAVSHAGLLGDSLAADDLAMAQAHAEHVVNILDGEDGRYFGDVNRDGSTQNPGDGVGVRGYLEQAGAANGGREKGDFSTQTAEAIETALQIIAVDSADEAKAISSKLDAELDSLASAIGNMQSADDVMADNASVEEASADSGGDLALIFDEADGLFATAASQIGLAVSHSGFLTDELAADSLDAAKSHAEHVINILDGEDGLYYGDVNRDGQTQNPGDGTGVRVYLEEALALVQSGDFEVDEELEPAIEQGLALVGVASEGALGIFTTETSMDATPFADTLATSLADLQAGVDEMQRMAPAMGDAEVADSSGAIDESDAMDDMDVPENVSLAVASLVSVEDGAGLLLNAQTQAELAIKHFTFLEDSLANGDLAMALAHAEHVINILDGEDGLLFGDNNRDGSTQNPGDGMGVRAYLGDAGEQIVAALDGSDAGEVQTLLDAIQQAEKAAGDSAVSAVQLFASGSAADAQVAADELSTLLAGLRTSIIAAVDAAAS